MRSYASGISWATGRLQRNVCPLSGSAIYRNRCDVAFPLSDHADHGELIEHVEETGAKKVFTVHGFTEEFAGDLRYLGIDALALGGGNQLELFR